MIADLIDDKLNIRLITRNVMAVYSSDSNYTDEFLLKLKHSNYSVNDSILESSSIISYIKKTYNQCKNIFRFVKFNKHIDENKFIEYVNYFDIQYILWLHFYQLDNDTLSIVELLMQLASDKPIIITSYIEEKYYTKIFSLLFHVGLEDRLIIIPFSDIKVAANNSTCQCYVKDIDRISIQSRFPEAFIQEELHISDQLYDGTRPYLYQKSEVIIKPDSYKYSISEYFLIILFSIMMLFIRFNNWRYTYVT